MRHGRIRRWRRVHGKKKSLAEYAEGAKAAERVRKDFNKEELCNLMRFRRGS